MRKAALTTMLVLLSLRSGIARADDEPPKPDEVLDRLEKVLSDLKDLSADVQVQTRGRQVPGHIALAYDEEYGRKTRKYRVETRSTTGGRVGRIKQVCDGQFLLVEVTDVAAGTTTVTRRRLKAGEAAPGQLGIDWHERIADYRKRYAFRMLGVGRFADEPVAIVLADEKTDTGNRPRLLMMVSTDDGFPRRVTVYPDDPKDAAKQIMVTFSNVKLNTGLPPGTFRYEPPAGVEVKDVD